MLLSRHKHRPFGILPSLQELHKALGVWRNQVLRIANEDVNVDIKKMDK
jgi:hypothetical protein